MGRGREILVWRLSSSMRLLLLLSEPAHLACADYFESRGCGVDTAHDVVDAERFLRFRSYDAVVLDDVHASENVLQHARQRNPAVRAAVLTTGTMAVSHEAFATVLTKPLPLATIYDAVMPAPAPEHRNVALRP